MYHVIIIEDDPMVASINKQYVEVTPEFRVDRIFKNGSEALPYLKTTVNFLMPSTMPASHRPSLWSPPRTIRISSAPC